MTSIEPLTNQQKDAFLDITVYVDRTAINVLQHYQRKGFTRLPATPTMTGAELKACVPGFNPSYELHLQRGSYLRDDPFVADCEALALTEGMHFYSVAPASYY